MLDPEFKINPSKIYLILLIFTFSITVWIVVSLHLIFFWKLCCLIFVFIYLLLITVRHGLLMSNSSIIGIKHANNKLWCIQTRTSSYAATLLGDSTITPFISILRFRMPDKLLPKSCVIFYDALKKNKYRQLVVLLKIN